METQVQSHLMVVEKLKTILSEDPQMAEALNASLSIAVKKAKQQLNSDLYHAIDDELKGHGWPTNVEEYYNYIDVYNRMVPNEKNDPNYPTAWKSNNEKNGYNKKVYDLLCQYYWLIDQKIPGTDLTMQSYKKFANWLVDAANSWGIFLDTEASLTQDSLDSFRANTMYNFDLYKDNMKNWKTFNQFFYREFNHSDPETGISPLRPIASPKDNKVVVSPADCTYKKFYPIDDKGNVIEKDKTPAKICLKHTHTIGTVDELLQHSKYAENFYGGTFVHYFLSPFDYHRFHTPVAGQVLEIIPVEGNVYLNVDLKDGEWDAPDGAGNGYEFTQARGLVVMDGGPEVGKVAILPIGMCQVSGVDMYTELQGKTVVKGQEFGKFRFGGSDIIMLFEKAPKDLYMFTKDPGHNPIHFQYGQASVLF
ncbi:phosphatidylserine decarboxylase [Tenacibaculum sp. M341]|uniref:phosphatidylserine decarboxylase n=1 Tax=Tenacibaculum sp. M341 TaxID=2530339 RepID=UPI001046A1BC|nr:phosphatidylserine decarboxylase [Tenacibaculum sp. M341]TCI92202.1 phosphatidylserine decarboxylase [Tenacibaculum sp. M341]